MELLELIELELVLKDDLSGIEDQLRNADLGYFDDHKQVESEWYSLATRAKRVKERSIERVGLYIVARKDAMVEKNNIEIEMLTAQRNELASLCRRLLCEGTDLHAEAEALLNAIYKEND